MLIWKKNYKLHKPYELLHPMHIQGNMLLYPYLQNVAFILNESISSK